MRESEEKEPGEENEKGGEGEGQPALFKRFAISKALNLKLDTGAGG